MTLEIKKRIEQIRNGDVPEGYKRTKAGIIPEKWEIKKLSDVLKKQTQKNTDNAIQNVLTNSATQGIVCQTDYFDKQIANNENTAGYYVVKPGYFVYNPRISVSAPCGPFNRYNGDKDGIMSPLYSVYCFCDKSITYADYLTYYFSSSKWHAYMNSIANYGARSDRMNVTGEDMNNMPIPYPPLPEQQKIVAILSAQDKVIECCEKKIEQLKRMKKYYLQNMFPKRGETVPKIRFKGFADAWEQRKITELGEIFIGLVTTMTSHYTNHGALLIRNSDIKDGRFEFGDNPIYLDYDFARQNAPRKHRAGDVITVHTGDIGTSAVITEKEDGSIGFATIVTRPNNKIIKSKYLCTYLNTDVHKAFAMNMSTGDGRNNYNLKDFYKCIVPVPSIPEQAMVSEFIEKMNNLITLHQRLRDEEKKKKKALQQLLLTGIVRL